MHVQQCFVDKLHTFANLDSMIPLLVTYLSTRVDRAIQHSRGMECAIAACLLHTLETNMVFPLRDVVPKLSTMIAALGKAEYIGLVLAATLGHDLGLVKSLEDRTVMAGETL